MAGRPKAQTEVVTWLSGDDWHFQVVGENQTVKKHGEGFKTEQAAKAAGKKAQN